MSNIFLESLLFWLVTGTSLFVVGYAIAQGTGKRSFALFGLVAAVLTIVLGICLVFFVDTDSKSIRRTIHAMENAVLNNDSDAALQYVAKNSVLVRKLFEDSMSSVTIERAKVSDLRITEINKTTSPPRATVAFRGMAAGKGHDGYPFTGIDNFSVELRQEQDGVWRVTDHIEFDRRF
ncbi:MAG: hypothetical protein IJM54_07595 [Thermoguttaceae bacterium]|nr:hypothetical protein [Thermoguttaceae bacterium]MBR5758268.1 hypothetical protein [Thermoguttaceae bacterium]